MKKIIFGAFQTLIVIVPILLISYLVTRSNVFLKLILICVTFGCLLDIINYFVYSEIYAFKQTISGRGAVAIIAVLFVCVLLVVSFVQLIKL